MAGLTAQHCSFCVIRVAPGEKVRPAHSHPHGEEVIYVMHGSGRVLVAGDVSPVREGSTVLFPQGAVHMLHNTGHEEMKVACFFAPGRIWITTSSTRTSIFLIESRSPRAIRASTDSRLAASDE